MPRRHVTAAAEYGAPAGYLYSLLADYREAHRRTLPSRWVRDYTVERGGRGAGTVIRFALPGVGGRRTVRAMVSEPEPGRVLLAADADTGATTTFTVEPTPSGGSRVIVVTALTVRGGWRGRIAGWVTTWLVGRVCRAQLARLAALVARPACDDGWSLPLAGLRMAARVSGGTRVSGGARTSGATRRSGATRASGGNRLPAWGSGTTTASPTTKPATGSRGSTPRRDSGRCAS